MEGGRLEKIRFSGVCLLGGLLRSNGPKKMFVKAMLVVKPECAACGCGGIAGEKIPLVVSHPRCRENLLS